MEQIFELEFANGHKAKTVRVHRSSDLSAVLIDLGLAIATPTLVLVGGASGIPPEGMVQLKILFTEVFAPLVQALKATVVDGGTDAGIMKLMGQARSSTQGTFPLVGVAAVGTVVLPNLPPPKNGAELEPNHSHFVLVPGALWGDEAPWIARVATSLSHLCPSLTVLVNGGGIAWQDVSNSIRAKRPVLVIAGSGRTADELAKAIRGDRSNQRAVKMVESGLLKVADLNEGLDSLTEQIHYLLSHPVQPRRLEDEGVGSRE